MQRVINRFSSNIRWSTPTLMSFLCLTRYRRQIEDILIYGYFLIRRKVGDDSTLKSNYWQLKFAEKAQNEFEAWKNNMQKQLRQINGAIDSLHASDIFCCLLINFANSLYPDQARQTRQNFHFGRYIVRYMVGNQVLWLRLPIAI